MHHNLILDTDSYKASHYLQYPPNTTAVSCYIESRGKEDLFDTMVFFGLQAFLKEYLTKPISQADIDQAEAFWEPHGLPFNRAGWEHILKKHHGYLPIAIDAVAEGTALPLHNVITQVVNTDPNCYWLTTYIETALLRSIWYPTTVASLSWYCKKILRHYLLETADSLDSLPFMLHDFGARGCSSFETARLGGLAHLVNFQGTDTVSGVLAAKEYYDEPMAGYSIPAAEHASICCWGKELETEAYAQMLKHFAGKNKLVAVVSDSYDIWHAVEQIWGSDLKQQVIDNGGTVVIRPDSGEPAKIVTKVLDILMEKYGYYTNEKGYKVLPDYLRLIQGDSVSPQTIEACLRAMQTRGQSADNISFGMGGALLQKVNRDTLKFAMKASATEIEGQWRDVYKDPVTDHSKRSKPGRQALILDPKQGYQTVRESELGQRQNLLQPVFRDGTLLCEWTLSEVRKRSELALS